MTETPREYKKRVDEKWINNEKNRDKLIKKIDEYELLDKDYKTVTKQQILDNFSKNQKAEKESEQYITIVSELEEIDEKYKELKEIKENLKAKKIEKEKMESEIANVKMDGLDQTTLDLQMAALNEKNARYEALESEIKGIEKDIKNRRAEIKEIESMYGKIPETKASTKNPPKEVSTSVEDKIPEETPSTLKEYHKQTLKELWRKDRTRLEMFKLLDEGTGIDDELKNKIEKEISDRFFEYYNKEQGTLRMRSARFMKNKLKNSLEKINEIKDIKDLEEKELRLQEIERSEKVYGDTVGKTRILINLSKNIDLRGAVITDCGKINGFQCFKVKDRNGCSTIMWGDQIYYHKGVEIGNVVELMDGSLAYQLKFGDKKYTLIWGYYGSGGNKEKRDFQLIGENLVYKEKDENGHCSVHRGDKVCSVKNTYEEIGDIQNIGDKPCFKAKNRVGSYDVYWGDDRCGGGYYNNKCVSSCYKEIGEIQNIGDKPCFKTKDIHGDYNVYRGTEKCSNGYYREIGDIQNIGDEPFFKAKDKNGDYAVYWGTCLYGDGYKEIGEIQNIGDKPCFKVKYKNGNCRVRRGKVYCGKSYYEEIGDIQNIGDKPYFKAISSGGYHYLVRGDVCKGPYKEIIGDAQVIGKEMVFKVKKEDGCYLIWGNRELGPYKEVGEIQNIGEKPVFYANDGEGKYVMWGCEHLGDYYEEIGDLQNAGGIPILRAKSKDGYYYLIMGRSVQGPFKKIISTEFDYDEDDYHCSGVKYRVINKNGYEGDCWASI